MITSLLLVTCLTGPVADRTVWAMLHIKNRAEPRHAEFADLRRIAGVFWHIKAEREYDFHVFNKYEDFTARETSRLQCRIREMRLIILRDTARMTTYHFTRDQFQLAYRLHPSPRKRPLEFEVNTFHYVPISHIRLRASWWSSFIRHRWASEPLTTRPFNKRLFHGFAEKAGVEIQDLHWSLAVLDYCLSRAFLPYDHIIAYFCKYV